MEMRADVMIHSGGIMKINVSLVLVLLAFGILLSAQKVVVIKDQDHVMIDVGKSNGIQAGAQGFIVSETRKEGHAEKILIAHVQAEEVWETYFQGHFKER
jgi:hypothetical protein